MIRRRTTTRRTLGNVVVICQQFFVTQDVRKRLDSKNINVVIFHFELDTLIYF